MNSIIVPETNLYADLDPELSALDREIGIEHDKELFDLLREQDIYFTLNVNVDRRTFERFNGDEDDPRTCDCGSCGTTIWLKTRHISDAVTVELQTTEPPMRLVDG